MKVNSTMRDAFLNAHIKHTDVARVMPLIETADVSLKCGIGIHNQRDWNASLKLRTYNTLKTQGIMS